jgi:hypothetical protein
MEKVIPVEPKHKVNDTVLYMDMIAGKIPQLIVGKVLVTNYDTDKKAWCYLFRLFRRNRAREALLENPLLRKRPGERIQQ